MASGNDMNKATETYIGFTHLIKWGLIVSLAAAALVVFLISR